VFHAGDGNLHPLILFDDNDPDAVARAEQFGVEILEQTVRLGGTISGEHGVGVEKIDQMCSQFDRGTLDTFLAIKQAFDPSGLLNPGKVIPSLHRCGEYGKRRGTTGHASAAATAAARPAPQFADLPRF
jgi:glycolate oxidase